MTSGYVTSQLARYAGEWAERTLTANSALDMPRLGLSMAQMDRARPGTPVEYDLFAAEIAVCALCAVIVPANFNAVEPVGNS